MNYDVSLTAIYLHAVTPTHYMFVFHEGADMDVCLTNYGHCNYISGKHACIFYDEVNSRALIYGFALM